MVENPAAGCAVGSSGFPMKRGRRIGSSEGAGGECDGVGDGVRTWKIAGMPNRWVARRLGMGHEVGVTRAVRRFRDDGKLAGRLTALEKEIGSE